MRHKKERKPSLTLQQVIDIADGAYPDGLVGMYHRHPSGHHGDTLAKFIAAELADTYDSRASREEQIAAAAHAMSNSIEALAGIRRALENT
jgi:hypothetical protein